MKISTKKHVIHCFCISVLLLSPGALAAPITDPADPRAWQGASLETFRSLLGLATLQDVVDANLLDDGAFPHTASYATTFSLPGAACGSAPLGITSPAYIGNVEGCSGFSYDPGSYAYNCGNVSLAEYAQRGSCLDMWWLQDNGDGDITTGNIWDLGAPSNQVAVFPIVDHGPMPQEAIEYSVYLSNNPYATTIGTDGNIEWVYAKLDKVYLEGWHSGWIADGFTTVWRLPDAQTFRYVNVISGGPGSMHHDGDDEIDTVIGLTFEGTPVCSSDMDGDGVCDDVDNCPAIANPSQEDTDNNGIGNMCDNQFPVCSSATVNPSTLWPPNHKLVNLRITGVTDGNGNTLTVTATSVFQDEAVNEKGAGNTSPDATLTPLAVRAERNGKGDGRVYHVNFTADDAHGGVCTGMVSVCVPHDQGQGNTCVDGGPLHNSVTP